jgi:methylenetetrahydrofolate--tRNA-(uracil-5-)-methyltransferase
LSKSIQDMVGEEHLAFYDAISPIVLAESIDMSKVFRASRWGRNVWSQGAQSAQSAQRADDEGDYLNCPMTKGVRRVLCGARGGGVGDGS